MNELISVALLLWPGFRLALPQLGQWRKVHFIHNIF